MCLIETKTHHHSTGHTETTTTYKRCPNAPASSKTQLCANVQNRNIGSSWVMERRPSPALRENDYLLVTESRDGRRRIYRDLTYRTGGTAEVRGAGSGSERSSGEKQRKGYMPPRAPTPPQAPRYPVFDLSSPAARRAEPVMRADGTAVYSLAPDSHDFSRAVVEGRPTRSRRSSFSSTSAQPDRAPRPSRESNASTKTRTSNTIRTGRNDPPSTLNPSNLPTRHSSLRSNSRHDSAASLPFEPPVTSKPTTKTNRPNPSTASNRNSHPQPPRSILKRSPTTTTTTTHTIPPPAIPKTKTNPTSPNDKTETENARQAQLERDRYTERARQRNETATSSHAGARQRQRTPPNAAEKLLEPELADREYDRDRIASRREARAALEGGSAHAAAGLEAAGGTGAEAGYEARLAAEVASVALEREEFLRRGREREREREEWDECERRRRRQWGEAQTAADADTGRRFTRRGGLDAAGEFCGGFERLRREEAGMRAPQPGLARSMARRGNGVVVHQVQPPVEGGVSGGTLRERGERVIAREGARAARREGREWRREFKNEGEW
ncbi:hypothetical protein MBLNU230_g4271t1 [Neophaeotheca triangularis]